MRQFKGTGAGVVKIKTREQDDGRRSPIHLHSPVVAAQSGNQIVSNKVEVNNVGEAQSLDVNICENV